MLLLPLAIAKVQFRDPRDKRTDKAKADRNSQFEVMCVLQKGRFQAADPIIHDKCDYYAEGL